MLQAFISLLLMPHLDDKMSLMSSAVHFFNCNCRIAYAFKIVPIQYFEVYVLSTNIFVLDGKQKAHLCRSCHPSE